jgi:hypothetical protein
VGHIPHGPWKSFAIIFTKTEQHENHIGVKAKKRTSNPQKQKAKVKKEAAA